MPELRRDPITRRWVIIATERAKRPSDFGGHSGSEENVEKLESCPFCEGNEHKTPPEILAFRKPESKENEPGWWVRVIPDRFPIVTTDHPNKLDPHGVGIYDEANAYGYHELIVETPKHLQDLSDLDPQHIYEVLWAYKTRTIDIKNSDDTINHILIVRNFGKEAGSRAFTSHSHSHLVALPITPKRILDELKGSDIFYRFHERCIFCDIVREELKNRERIIAESDHFVAISFFAARVPFEIHILPKRHNPYFENSTEEELRDLGKLLKEVLTRLKIAANPAYNMIFHSAPYKVPSLTNFPLEEIYHWHIEITPRLTKAAGFEWGSGFHINPLPPENAAKYLREIII